MSKKIVIAAVAVVVALVVIKTTWIGSHARLWRKQIAEYARSQVAPEQEIQRLKMELKNLEKEDDRHYHKVATQIVEVQKIETQVAAMKKDLDERETRIKAMKNSLVGEEKFVTYKGERFARTDLQAQLRVSAQRFQVDEETVKSKQEQLATMKQTLEVNRKKLSELKLVRQQMMTELQRLETALVAERQAQAAENNTLDDASYLKLRKEMNAVKDRIEVLKQKRALKGDVEGPVRAAEQRKEQEEAIDRYLDARFGDKQ
jgi:peptidoglycan hydrolase CwlO-like protein